MLLYITRNSIKHQSFVYTQLNVKNVRFQTIQFSIVTLYKCETVLFDPLIELYQVIPQWVIVDLGAMAMKGYSTFLKGQELLKPHQLDCLVSYIQDTHLGSLTPLQRCSWYILQPKKTGPSGLLIYWSRDNIFMINILFKQPKSYHLILAVLKVWRP